MKMTVRDVDWKNKRALVRVDFNVPYERGTNRISDDIRIREAIPTIEYIRERGASVVLCTHLGRPNGKPSAEFDLDPIAARLSELMATPVTYVRDAPGLLALETVGAMAAGDVILLQNIRFWPGEELNDDQFASALAKLGDVYVNDAFGTAHRAHASTAGVASHLPAVAGLLMEKEIEFLGAVLNAPERPLSALLGGAKVGDKLKVLDRLVGHADELFVGGGMAATFLKAQGLEIGASLYEDNFVGFCADILEGAAGAGTRINLPSDVVVADRLAEGVPTRTRASDAIQTGDMILDIGSATAAEYAKRLSGMGTVVWNGPMGVFEIPPFDAGTKVVAHALAASTAVTVIGGGSTAEAVDHLHLADKMSHVSTGGGASLEFLEGTGLPGIAALDDK